MNKHTARKICEEHGATFRFDRLFGRYHIRTAAGHHVTIRGESLYHLSRQQLLERIK